MSKKFYILVFILTGLFLIPVSTYACGKSSEKSSCEKKIAYKEKDKGSCEKDCCKKGDESKKDEKGCNGKCDHSNCTTSALHYSLITANEFEFNNNLFNFSLENPVPYYKNINISDGFTSIWLRPKIK